MAVLKAAKRACDLIKQILTFSRQMEHELRPLLLAPGVKESLKLLAAVPLREYPFPGEC